jgi:hypothetical protein
VRGHIARSLAEGSPALVVVGSQGRRLVGRALLGSVSHEVLLNLDAPVVVVHNPAERDEVSASASGRSAEPAST